MLGLAGGGVYPADAVTSAAVRSYRTFSPLPVPQRAIGCVFSVALSRGSPRVAVSHHRALSCSDFPPAETDRRPPDPLKGTLYHKSRSKATTQLDMRGKIFVVSFGKILPAVHPPAFPAFLGCLGH